MVRINYDKINKDKINKDKLSQPFTDKEKERSSTVSINYDKIRVDAESFGVTKDEIQSGGAWKSGNKPVFGVMDNVGVARPSSTFPTPTRWSDAEKAAEKAIADGVVTPKEKGDVIRSTRKASEGDTTVYKGYDDKLNYFRNERNDYYKAAASGRTPANVKAYTRYDASKPVSAGNLSKSGFVLGEKIKNGSATDDDFRTYVNTEANYIQSKYDEFLGVLTLDGKKYTVTSDDEIWDNSHDYEAEAQAIYGDIDKAFVKWMNGDIDNASLYSLAHRKNRFDEREKVYFSDLWKDRGSVESSGTLKRKKKENSLDYGEADMRVRNLETTLGNYEQEAWNWEASNPNYKYGVISDDNPYKVYVDETRAELDEDKAVRDGYSLDSGRAEKALEYDFIASVKDIYDDYKADYDKSGKDYINDSGILHVLSDASGDLVETDEAYSNASEFVDRYAHYYDARINGPINTLRDYGTDQEKAIFVQLYKEKGEDAAVKYANDINPLFKDRVEAATSEKYKNSDDTGRFFLGLGASFWGGLGGDFAYGMEGLSRALSGDDSYHPRNTSQIIADTVASPEVEPNAVARFGMGAVRTTSNQIPSMAVGYATGGFSAAGGVTGFLAKAAPSAVMFANVFGSSYSESINKGNGYWESVGYAGTVAGFETATEKIFDIPKLYGGSKVDDAITGAISRGIGKLNAGSKTKAALSFAGYMGVNALGEGFEEGVAELFSPVWSNLWLGEQNEMFTEEHWKEIGYASLLGSASALLMGGLTMPNIYSEAKGDTAVWSVLNGKAKSVYEIDAVLNNESSKKLFEKVIGIELSDNADVARMQVAAVSSAVSAWYAKNSGKKVSDLMKTLTVSDAGSVAEFVEKAAEVIPEPDAEYVANETAAVAEMTEIANEELAKTSTGAVQRIIEGTANSNDYHAVSKDAEARAEFTKMTGVELSAIPGEARSQMRAYASQKASDSPSETIVAVADQAVEETVSDLMDGVSAETASVNEGVETDEELADYGVSDRQAALERAVDGDVEVASYESGSMSEAEYNEAVTRRASEIERSISESDGDVSEADSVPVADGVTENGGTKFMSKDEFDVVRNNSYSVTRNSAKDIKANLIFAKVSASDIRAFRAVGKALGVEVKAFDGEALGLTGTDGAYDNKTRTIYLNVTSPLKAISSAFRHEVIHYLKASSPKAYGEFARFVIDKYKAQYSNEDYNAWLEAKRKEYEAMGETLTRDGAEEEFLAQFGMDMLQQKAIARDFVRHHHKAAVRIFEAIREKINEIRRFFGWKELPSNVYAAIRYMAEDSSGQVQVYGNSYTRSHLRGSKELLPGELNIDALNAADEALLNAFVEVANINKSIQAKLKNAPKDVLNDDVKRAELVNSLWEEETGVKADGEVRFSEENEGTSSNTLDEHIADIAKSFGITNINDYVSVQRGVFNTLVSEGFFTDEGGRSKTVVNSDSGMTVEINKSSIDETFSKGSKYENLGKKLKYLKLSTIRNIDELFINAKLILDNEKGAVAK